MRKKFSLMKNRFARMIIFCGVVLIAVVFIILRYEGFFEMIGGFIRIMRPVIIGGVLAFALNRPMNHLHILYKRLFAWVRSKTCGKCKDKPKKELQIKHLNILKSKRKKEEPGRAPFVLACVTTYLLTIAILAAIIGFVIPQLYDSIKLFGSNLNGYIHNFRQFLEENKHNIERVLGNSIDLGDVIEKVAVKFRDFIENLAKDIPNMLSATMSFTSDIIGILVDIVFGIAFSVYILLDKEKLKKNAGVVARLVIRGTHYDHFERIISMAYTTFSNFITGQLIEAAIVGGLCFMGMLIIGLDYAPLISVIVGVTNLIPIAGPIIGTIPGAFILLLINPMDALWFVIYIIIIQQLDCNFIYPRIVGNKVGLPSLWVLFAITLGGGLAGVIGMILGVPILSIIYALLSEKFEEAKLKKEQEEQPMQASSPNEEVQENEKQSVQAEAKE